MRCTLSQSSLSHFVLSAGPSAGPSLRPIFGLAVIAASLPLLASSCSTGYAVESFEPRAHGLDLAASQSASARAASQRRDQDLVLERPSLENVTRYALRHNESLQAAFARWRARLERIAQVSALPDPSLGFTEFLQDLETRTGPQRRRIRLAQRFPWFGTLAERGKRAAAEAEAAWHGLRAQRLGLASKVARTYAELFYLGERRRLVGATLELLRELEPVVRSKILGGGGQREILRLQIEIGKLEDLDKSLLERLPVLREALAALMNWQGSAALALSAPHAKDFPAITDLEGGEALRAQALRENPELERLRQISEARNHDRILADKRAWPNMQIGATWMDTGPARKPGVEGSGKDPWAIDLSFELPLWRDAIRAGQRAARFAHEAVERDRAELRLRVLADVETARFDFRDAQRQLALYRNELLPRARDSLQLDRVAYRTGRADFLDLLDAERVLLEFETVVARATRDAIQARARLESLLGTASLVRAVR